MANRNETIDLTRVGGFKRRPKVSITAENTSKKMSSVPNFLGVVPFQLGQDTINACYFKDAIKEEGDYYCDLGMLMLPNNFRYVDYRIEVANGDTYSVVIDVDGINKTNRKANLFAPMLLNLNKVAEDDNFFHHCANSSLSKLGSPESWTNEGCIPDNSISAITSVGEIANSFKVMESEGPLTLEDKPFILFYYESKNNLRTKQTLGDLDTLPVIEGEDPDKTYKYYLMLLQMSEKNFVYYAIDAEGMNDYKDGQLNCQDLLNDWVTTKYTANVKGIGVDHRLYYNDDLMVFITSSVHLVE